MNIDNNLFQMQLSLAATSSYYNITIFWIHLFRFRVDGNLIYGSAGKVKSKEAVSPLSGSKSSGRFAVMFSFSINLSIFSSAH